MSLEALKALKDKMKKEKEELVGDKKHVRKAELEAARLKRLREEEEEERKQKEARRKAQRTSEEVDADNHASGGKEKEEEVLLPLLSKEEVIRRLRKLGHPATLFGEDDVDRLKRLVKAEKEVHVEDEMVGGQQENVILSLQREEREKEKLRAKQLASLREAEGRSTGTSTGASTGAPGSSTGADGHERKDAKSAARPAGPASLDSRKDTEEEDATMTAFKRAAALLAEKREEESMAIEDRCGKWIKRWMKEWEEDLERRPDHVRMSGSGHQTTLVFGQTQKYLEPLYERLKRRVLHEELRAGLWMMVQAMRDRNYLYANDIYLRLAIGNAPWPIGVTSVGIHERSAREKISHVMNAHGQAHIMNDEATRKYLQAMKRLISAVQRMYPTDPSRSVDFETIADPGKGVAGGGSTKLALLQAEAKGETWQALGLSQAPHFMEKDGKVMVPPKWQHILAKEKSKIGEMQPADGNAREQSSAP